MNNSDQPISETTETTTNSQAEKAEKFDVTNPNSALLVLVNAARIGQSKGIFTLEEAELISRAIKTFSQVEPKGPQATSA